MTATTDGSTGALPPRAAAASETTEVTTPEAAGTVDTRDAARHAILRATDFLLSTQDAQGWWKGDLETNVTMDAEDLLLRQFLGIRDETTTPRRRPLHPRRAARGRHLGQFLRRTGRTLHHHRGVRRAAAGR